MGLQAKTPVEGQSLFIVPLHLQLERLDTEPHQRGFDEREGGSTDAAATSGRLQKELGDGRLPATEFEIETQGEHEMPDELTRVGDQPSGAEGRTLHQLQRRATHDLPLEGDAIESIVLLDEL